MYIGHRVPGVGQRHGISVEEVEDTPGRRRQIELHLGMAVRTKAAPATSAATVNPYLFMDYVASTGPHRSF